MATTKAPAKKAAPAKKPAAKAAPAKKTAKRAAAAPDDDEDGKGGSEIVRRQV
jgi:hypothetical protein